MFIDRNRAFIPNYGERYRSGERISTGFHRVLRPGGLLVLQEPMAGPVQPPIFPLMWARDATTSFVRTPTEMRALIEAVGFRVRVWDDVPAETSGASAPAAVPTIQALVMGERLAEITHNDRRNREEGRLVRVQAVFDRP